MLLHQGPCRLEEHRRGGLGCPPSCRTWETSGTGIIRITQTMLAAPQAEEMLSGVHPQRRQSEGGLRLPTGRSQGASSAPQCLGTVQGSSGCQGTATGPMHLRWVRHLKADPEVRSRDEVWLLDWPGERNGEGGLGRTGRWAGALC